MLYCILNPKWQKFIQYIKDSSWGCNSLLLDRFSCNFITINRIHTFQLFYHGYCCLCISWRNNWFQLFFCISELHVMMKKKEAVAEFTEGAHIVQHAKVALLVCALDASYAVFQIALARLVLTLQGMPKLEFISSCS